MDNTQIQKISKDESQPKDPYNTTNTETTGEFTIVSKKTEKLASAVYLITNLFLDSEPMKWTLRKKVSELLSHITTYGDIRQSEFPNFKHSAETKIGELVSFLEVSTLGGLVSHMNSTILKQEFSNLLNLLKMDYKTDFSSNLIPGEFFNQEHTLLSVNRNNTVLGVKDIITLKDKSAFKSNNRQGIILNLLKKKKELNIKDIAAIIKDVSEKTIQRELISLISAGILTKTGERRWSRYSLNSSQ